VDPLYFIRITECAGSLTLYISDPNHTLKTKVCIVSCVSTYLIYGCISTIDIIDNHL